MRVSSACVLGFLCSDREVRYDPTNDGSLQYKGSKAIHDAGITSCVCVQLELFFFFFFVLPPLLLHTNASQIRLFTMLLVHSWFRQRGQVLSRRAAGISYLVFKPFCCLLSLAGVDDPCLDVQDVGATGPLGHDRRQPATAVRPSPPSSFQPPSPYHRVLRPARPCVPPWPQRFPRLLTLHVRLQVHRPQRSRAHDPRSASRRRFHVIPTRCVIACNSAAFVSEL
jgi:hypothetical protein